MPVANANLRAINFGFRRNAVGNVVPSGTISLFLKRMAPNVVRVMTVNLDILIEDPQDFRYYNRIGLLGTPAPESNNPPTEAALLNSSYPLHAADAARRIGEVVILKIELKTRLLSLNIDITGP